MSQLPNVTLIGDNSGGGGGIPAYTELSNGWLLRVSSTRIFTPEGINIENGIAPDIRVEFSDDAIMKNTDPILDFGIEYLRNQ